MLNRVKAVCSHSSEHPRFFPHVVVPNWDTPASEPRLWTTRLYPPLTVKPDIFRRFKILQNQTVWCCWGLKRSTVSASFTKRHRTKTHKRYVNLEKRIYEFLAELYDRRCSDWRVSAKSDISAGALDRNENRKVNRSDVKRKTEGSTVLTQSSCWDSQ